MPSFSAYVRSATIMATRPAVQPRGIPAVIGAILAKRRAKFRQRCVIGIRPIGFVLRKGYFALLALDFHRDDFGIERALGLRSGEPLLRPLAIPSQDITIE